MIPTGRMMLDLTQVQLLHEAGPCLVVYKPPGLLTQAPPGIDNLELRVKRFLQQREGKSHNLYLAIIHRLDRPVSGALVLARHVRAAQRLSEQFEQRTVTKKYWALVEGMVADGSAVWTDWMRKVPGEARSELVTADHPDAQQAILRFVVRARFASSTWLEIELETGRTHQIRLQCFGHGHPILGDILYGAKTTFGPVVEDERSRWIALHARQLAFEHPMTRELVDVRAPLPEGWPEELRLSS